MSENEEAADKSFEPTQRKLEQQRKKGELARSTDLLTSASYFGALVSFLVFGGYCLIYFGNIFIPYFDHKVSLSIDLIEDPSPVQSGHLIIEVFLAGYPFFIVPLLFVFTTLISSRTLVFSIEKLAIKGSRISILSNAKNKFGRSGLFEFLKSFTKLLIYSILLGFLLYSNIDILVGSSTGTTQEVVQLMLSLILEFVVYTCCISLAIGIVDYTWQHFDHLRKNRMTHKEMRDEVKESEGDPFLKAKRTQRGQEIALSQMIADIKEADVVIVNPTHFAVVLKWTRKPGSAPLCVAKGVDSIALNIRKVAGESGVPIHSDPPTARALFATTKIGEEIAPKFYKPVAAAIRFAEQMRHKARRGY
ncbi:flagellar biosynthesis protein FlhB [Cognatishimia sp. F0-27]|uniref:EscU/YscU/HrcU family type III secretion system export apparatus switch protein n=1 Tax=Cognatishimia sp. F0-27 TaxID=2816855 RepID=UPI001D0C2AEE|nr:flagellar type III secretion system protein FlhB [Cognatishimia sp. F0-27]MCC1495110.1 flagellar biosynthesis protein FlhB [Cognatishimia sp. F0-27]